MDIADEDATSLRSFLIGALEEEEESAVGERMLTDDLYLDQAEMLETELIEDYLDEKLSPDDRHRFETYFLGPPSRREKLRVAMALREYVNADAAKAKEAVYAKPIPVQTPELDPASPDFASPGVAESPGVGGAGPETSGLREAGPAPKPEPQTSGPVASVIPIKPSRTSAPAFSYFRFAMVAMVLVALGGLAWYLSVAHKSNLQKGESLLSGLYKDSRPLESRLASFNWAPVAASRGGTDRGGGDQDQNLQGQADLQRERAQAALERAVKEEPGPASEHAFGVFCLTERKFDEAAGHLRVAVNGDPENAAYHNDLGVALLEQGKVARNEQGTQKMADAQHEFESALKIQPDFKPALFNRALAWQALRNWGEAESAWTTYLEADPNSPWANEAREHLTQVKQRMNSSSIYFIPNRILLMTPSAPVVCQLSTSSQTQGNSKT